MRRFSIRSLLTAIVVISLMPVALLGYLFVAQDRKETGFAQKELFGLRYLQAIGPDLGSLVSGEPLTQNQAFADVAKDLDPLLGSGSDAQAYLKIRAQGAETVDLAATAASKLIASVADGSNLTLDPDLDSFYTMDLLTTKLPGVVTAAVTAIKAAKSASENSNLDVALTNLATSSAGLQASFDAASRSNSDGSVRVMSDDIAQLTQAVSTFITVARSAEAGGAAQAARTTLSAAVGKLEASGVETLRHLLQARIDRLNTELIEVLVLAGGLLLATIVASVLSARSILGKIKLLEKNIRSIAAGSQDVRLDGLGRDEISFLTRAVADLRDQTIRRLEEAETQKAAERDSTMAMERQAAAEREQNLRSTAEAAAAQRVVIDTLAEALTALSKGDLDSQIGVEFPGDLETLRVAFNTTVESLDRIIGQLRSTSASLRVATREILSGANDLADRTTKQAAAVEETSAAMEQLSATVGENSLRSNEANRTTKSVATAAAQTGGIMTEANSAMERIRESSARISGIIGMIDDIAFQTNLLALNASVEAARAGDAGKGFAVVAVEVRRLAQSAAAASTEVKSLVEMSAAEVANGAKLVSGVASIVEQMLTGMQQSSDLVQSIADASKEQASSIKEVLAAIKQMDEMTQHNAALVEETNAAIEQTEDQATELDRAVAVFSSKRELERQPGAVNPRKGSTGTGASRYRIDGNAALSNDWAEF